MKSATLGAAGPSWADSVVAAVAPRRVDPIETFADLYDEHVAFVHRGARRLGVPEAAIEDVVQEVFLVAYRRFAEFRQASSLQTWLYGILMHVARTQRRSAVRAGLHGVIVANSAAEADRVASADSLRPDATVERADAWRTLERVLSQLDEDKREIFVLAELEQISVPDIAQLLGIKLNTAYSRLRLARAAFEDALERTTGAP